MSLVTAATFTAGQLQYTVQIRAVEVELTTLPGSNRAEVSIAAGVNVEAVPGDEAELELDGGDGAATVITGVVDHVERHPTSTVVSVVDGGAAMARVRPQETYSGMLFAQVISALAQLAGVGTNLVTATTQTAAYVADPRRTASEHVASLAALAGSVATIDGSGKLSVMPWPTGLPTAAMRLDREFLSISTTNQAPQHEFALVGGGGAAMAAAPDAWVMNTEPLTNADDPDESRTWLSQRVLRTTADVDAANRGLEARRASATMQLRALCWLQPGRRPGDIIEIQETQAPNQGGPWLITGVHHHLSPTRSTSALSGVSAGDTTSLMGSIGGAIGGLL